MIDTREFYDLLTFLIVQIPFWIGGAAGHYLNNRDKVIVPFWLRVLFGDFRRSGALDKSSMAMQITIYIAMEIALLYTLFFRENRAMLLVFYLLELFIGNGIVSWIQHRSRNIL